MSLLDLVQQQLGASGTQQIADQIGADPATTQNAIQAALPMLLGGMASASRQPEGASAINNLLGQTQSLGGLGGVLGSVLGGGAGGAGGGLGGALGNVMGGGGGGDLGGMLGGLLGGGGGLGGMLGSILGGHQETVEQGVQQASGLGSDQTRRLLMILAPIAIAAIAHQRSQANQQQASSAAVAGAGAGGGADLDGNGIPDVLEQEARHAQSIAPPGVGGILGRILNVARGSTT